MESVIWYDVIQWQRCSEHADLPQDGIFPTMYGPGREWIYEWAPGQESMRTGVPYVYEFNDTTRMVRTVDAIPEGGATRR